MAKYDDDDKYYRAVIVDLCDDNEHLCTIRFIDFGNTEVVNIGNLRELDSRFSRLPQFAFAAQLTAHRVLTALVITD